MKGVGRVYQQTVIDTYAKVVFAKLYDRKTPITPAEILNDRVVPFYDEHGHCQLKQRWYAPAVGGAVVRYGEVLGTPIGLSPSEPRGDRKLTSTPLS